MKHLHAFRRRYSGCIGVNAEKKIGSVTVGKGRARAQAQGAVLTARKQHFEPAVEELLGLDFGQFTKTIVLPQGEAYDFTRYSVGVSTANRRLLSVRTDYAWGGFFSGDRQDASVSLGLRPMPGITINRRSKNWSCSCRRS